jgi:hypothetical protein
MDPDLSDILVYKNLADKTNIDLTKPPPASGVLDTPKVVQPKPQKFKPGAVRKGSSSSSVPAAPPASSASAPAPSSPSIPPISPPKPKSGKTPSPPRKKEEKKVDPPAPAPASDDVISDNDKSESESESSESESESESDSETDENDPKVKREKTFYLHELERLRLQGVRLTQKYTLRNKLHDIRFEFEAHKSNSESLDRLKFMTDTAKWVFMGIEWINSKAGPFLHLQGWSQNATQDMTRYYPCFEKLYQKYFRKMQISPIMEFFFLVMGSAFFWHMQQSFLGGFMKGPLGVPVPPTASQPPPSYPPQQQQPTQPKPIYRNNSSGVGATVSSGNAFGKNIPIGRDILKPPVQVPVHNSMPFARQPSWLNPKNNNEKENKQTASAKTSGKSAAILEPPPMILSDSDSDTESNISNVEQSACPLRDKRGTNNDNNDSDDDEKISDTPPLNDDDEGNFTDEEIES